MTLIHAGLPPQWTLAMAQAYAAEVEAALRGPDYLLFLDNLDGQVQDQGVAASDKWERLRYITHCLSACALLTPPGDSTTRSRALPAPSLLPISRGLPSHTVPLPT